MSCDDYKQAEPDPLHAIYDTLINDLNITSLDELMIVANEFMKKSDGAMKDTVVTSCRLAHIDRLGIDIHTVNLRDNEVVDIRIPFRLPVQTESDARSTITMMAQHAWEQDKKYTPPNIQWDVSDEE